MPNTIVWLDLETGGLDPALHQITQIAALATEGDDGLRAIGEPFECKVALASGHYTKEALDRQNFDMGVWDAEAIPIQEALSKLYDWCEPLGHDRVGGTSGKTYKAADVAGYNIQFDADFLGATAKRSKIWLPLALWTGGMFDVLQLVKWKCLMAGEALKNFQLETVCKHFGLRDFGAHDALEDIRATARLARSMMAGF